MLEVDHDALAELAGVLGVARGVVGDLAALREERRELHRAAAIVDSRDYADEVRPDDRLLEAHPNLHLDTSATKWMVRELGRHSRDEIVSFLEKRAPQFPMKVSDGLPDIFPSHEIRTFS